MPNIREYTSPVNSLTPDNFGAAATAEGARATARGWSDLGRGIGEGMQAVGQVVEQYQTRHEISAKAAELAKLQNNLTQSWNQLAANADPNDHDLAQRFQEGFLEPVLDQFSEGLSTKGGKDWAASQVASLRSHFYEKTSADQAIRAGRAADQNLDTLKNNLSELSYADPSSYQHALAMTDNSIAAMIRADPNLTPEMAARMQTELSQSIKTDIAKAAALGMIERNPDQGKVDVANGQFANYLTGDEIATLQSHAGVIKRQQEADAKSAETEQLKVRKRDLDGKLNEIAAATIENGGDPPPGAALALANLARDYHDVMDPGELRAMDNWLHKPQDDKAVTDPATYSDFRQRQAAGSLTAGDVFNAAADKRLSKADMSFFLQWVSSDDKSQRPEQKDFQHFLDGYKSYITKSSMLNVDAYGDQRWYEWQHDAQQYHDYAKSKGATEEAIRKDIVNSISRYQPSASDGLKGTTSKAEGVTPKPLPPPVPPGPRQQAPTPASRLEEMRKVAHGG